MARREYRSVTGKTLGYSQTDTRSFGSGGWLAAIILLALGIVGYFVSDEQRRCSNTAAVRHKGGSQAAKRRFIVRETPFKRHLLDRDVTRFHHALIQSVKCKTWVPSGRNFK